MILYGVSAEVSIGELFIAGFGPGLLIGGALMLFVYVYCKIKGWGKNDGDGRQSFGKATWKAGWALMMPVIILAAFTVYLHPHGSIGGGRVLFPGGGPADLQRDQVEDLFIILRKSVLSSAVIMFIIANAGCSRFSSRAPVCRTPLATGCRTF